MRKPTQFETLRCAAGHTWQAPLRDAVLGDCTRYGVKLVCEGHETCPDCGLLPGTQEYCWVCDEPLSQERIGEIAAAADHPEALGPRDFLCAAHAEAVAGDDCNARRVSAMRLGALAAFVELRLDEAELAGDAEAMCEECPAQHPDCALGCATRLLAWLREGER